MYDDGCPHCGRSLLVGGHTVWIERFLGQRVTVVVCPWITTSAWALLV